MNARRRRFWPIASKTQHQVVFQRAGKTASHSEPIYLDELRYWMSRRRIHHRIDRNNRIPHCDEWVFLYSGLANQKEHRRTLSLQGRTSWSTSAGYSNRQNRWSTPCPIDV